MAKSKSNGFTRGKKRGGLFSAQSQRVLKPVTYVEKMQSKLTVLKKKMEIGEEQNKYGPSNKVNLPGDHHYSQLYFNTNPDILHLNKDDIKNNNNIQRSTLNNYMNREVKTVETIDTIE